MKRTDAEAALATTVAYTLVVLGFLVAVLSFAIGNLPFIGDALPVEMTTLIYAGIGIAAVGGLILLGQPPEDEKTD
ncbi:MAG: hypothetical protein ACOCT0_03100 [Halobacteriota archaeon]